jgi:heme A synthase
MTRFARYAWGVLGWNLIVILWGAFVRATGSGAGCGRHWPSCQGEVIPQPKQIETLIEFTHRAVSGVALLLVLGLLIWGLRACPKGHPARKGIAASTFFILLEALLGAGLVLFQLTAENQSAARAIAVALHLANTFLLVASLALTAHWASGGEDFHFTFRAGWPFLIGLAGVLLIGMSGAITALGDTLFPASSIAEGIRQETTEGAHFLVRLRIIHPIIAVLIGTYTLRLSYWLYHRHGGLVRRLSVTLAALTAVQLAAGVTNLLLLAPIPMQIIHLLLADLVWIVYILTAAAGLAFVPSQSPSEAL